MILDRGLASYHDAVADSCASGNADLGDDDGVFTHLHVVSYLDEVVYLCSTADPGDARYSVRVETARRTRTSGTAPWPLYKGGTA